MATNPRHVKLSKSLLDVFATRMDNLDRQIESQKTSKSGSMFIRSGEENEDGSPKGTGTLIGAGATSGGIAPWVNDTTPPGRPTGAVADSGNGMILLRWDGTLEGGIPDDFDHISWFVDGVERGRLMAKGVSVVGPLDVGSVHSVYAVAFDNAHNQEGDPTPNASDPTPTESVTVSGADIDPDVLGIIVTKTDKDPDTPGKHTGDLWLRYDREAEGRNVLHNPGFETGDLSNWACNWVGLGNVKTDSPHSGRYSFTGSPRANSWSEMSSNETITVHDGDTVVIRAWVSQYNLTRPGFYLTYRPTETGIAYTPDEAYCNITNGNSTFAQYEKRYTYHGSGTQHWRMLLTTQQDATDGRYLNMDDFEFRIMSKGALAASWWWNGTSWVQLPIAMYLDQLAVRNVQVDEAVIGMLSTGIVQSATFTTPDGLTGFDTDGFWVKNPDGSYAFLANKSGIILTGTFQTDNDTQARLVISKKIVQGPGGVNDKRTLNNIDFYPARDPARIAASIALWDSGATTQLILGDNDASTGGKSAHPGTITLRGTGNLKDRSIDAEAEEINIGKALDSYIAVTSKEGNFSTAGDITVKAMRNLLLSGNSAVTVCSNNNDTHSFKTFSDHTELNGNVWLNGKAVTGQSRRIVEWISDWSGTPVHAEGTTKWEYETDIYLRNSPTNGQWLMAELGARVIANNGEYFMTISITGGDGNEYFSYSLSSTRSPGTDNFTASKLFMLPNGTYHVKLGFTRWGSPAISGDTRFAFKDWTPGRGIKTGFRYFTLTELN